MTTDEMVREIMQLFSAVDYEGRTRPVVLTVYPDRCTARACSHAVDVQGGATAALAALRDQLRDKASDALAEHEAKAETLRKALGVPSPTYEARTTPPTLAERKVHQEAGGAWLVCRPDSDGKLHSDVLIGWHGWRWEGCIFMALDAERRLCAWPVGGEL